ncbi:serine/threonine-protein phosphatase 4 regulatory subunit 3B-like [Pithys albifrons albifrons]|uniref:serine/threonine-protein phosphatase 4 regulatory subunit 3B-like n=1 Tax=Pithys albifrons albifrons TaxID=3385563 RepID=UPI003A5CE1EF
MSGISLLMDLPTCKLHRLREIANLLTSVRRSRVHKEKVALVLRQKGYIPKLLQLFQVLEHFKDTEGLHLLFDIVRGILYLDEAILFEVMFSDECILDVVGCLEYDPCLAQPERHRKFLTERVKLQEFIPVRDPQLRHRIRQMSIAHYIHAIILPNPSAFEEGFLSTLSSFIRCSKEEILSVLQKDETFLAEIFAKLKDKATADKQRCELMKFLREFCAFFVALHTKRDEFLNALAKLGILPTLEMLMGMKNLQVRSAATDILSYLVHFSPSMVQEFIMKEAHQSNKNTQLLIVTIKQMIYNPDCGLGGENQLMEILCILINPKKMQDKATKPEIREFLKFFYNRCIHILTAPLLAGTSEESSEKDNYRTAEILSSVLELLSFCVQQHKYHMKKYVIRKDLLRRVLVLMKSQHKFLALSALRFMRRIIGLKDDLYNSYIIQGNLLEPVVNALLDNGTRCNLLSSAVVELLEFIRAEDIQSLIAHIVENFSAKLESVKYVRTFQEMKTKYKQEKNWHNKTMNSVPSIMPGKTFVRGAILSKADEKQQISEVEEQAAPASPEGSNVFCPACNTSPTVMSPVKRGLFEIFGFPDEDEKAPPRKRAHLDC